MVKFEHGKIIIEIEDSSPQEFVTELRISLIRLLQDREMNEYTDLIDVKETNYMVLELLKNLEDPATNL